MALFKKHKTEPVPPEDTGAHDTSVGTAADVEAVMKKYDRESNTRVWEGLPKLVIRWLMVAFSAYCIIDTVFLSTRQEVRLPMFVGLILLFGFLTFPAKKGDERVNHMPWYDIVLLIAGPGAYFFYAVNAQNVVQMSARVMQNDLYMIIGLIGILALVELCRRCVGLPILCVAGVLLVREDVELMSTALNYFAAALKDGADLVLSDAVFGYNGATALYQSDAHISCTGCALVSRALLDRCRAAAKDPESVSELLDAAARLSERCTRVPQALLHFERDICAEDAYSLHGKRAFLISHVLDMTGAPIVMVSAVPVLRSMGYEVTVLGPSDNGSLQLFRDAGAAVITRAGCVSSPALWGLALCADFVIVNTVVSGRVLRALSDTGVPVLWWLHDAFAGYPHIAHQIPKTIAPNVEVYSVGKHAAAAMHAVRPEFEIKQLIYGLPDYSKEDFPVYDLGYANGRPLFVTVGSFERRKGQDIFCKAIRLLPPEVRQKASFLFVGKAADREMMDAVRNLTADCPANVFYCKRLSRDEIKSLMQQCTCLVCASRDDPMPTFVTEGLIFGKPSIVSEHTGTAGLVTEGVDGFVYRDDDPAQLEKLLCWAIEHPAELAAMHDDCRALYERYYSKEAFARTLTTAVKELTEKVEQLNNK